MKTVLLLLLACSATHSWIILGTCNCTSMQPLMGGKFTTVGDECFERGVCKRVLETSKLMIWWNDAYRPKNSKRKMARPHLSFPKQEYYSTRNVDVWRLFKVSCENGIWKVGHIPYNITIYEDGTNKEVTMQPDEVNKLGLKHELRYVGCSIFG